MKALPTAPAPAPVSTVTQRVDAVDWQAVEDNLDQYGNAMLPGLLTSQECDALAAKYSHDDLYRSRVVMARHMQFIELSSGVRLIWCSR